MEANLIEAHRGALVFQVPDTRNQSRCAFSAPKSIDAVLFAKLAPASIEAGSGGGPDASGRA